MPRLIPELPHPSLSRTLSTAVAISVQCHDLIISRREIKQPHRKRKNNPRLDHRQFLANAIPRPFAEGYIRWVCSFGLAVATLLQEALWVERVRVGPVRWVAVQAYVDGESAELTPTEFRLLYALALDQGRVLTRDELLQRVWGRRASHRDRTVDVFVRKLREKVDTRAPHHTFIQTRYGVGYKLDPAPK